MNNELERVWKEAIVAYLNSIYRLSPGGAGTPETPQSG
jgi:hypothetical protein